MDESGQGSKYPIQRPRTKPLSRLQREALEAYRIRLFYSKDKPVQMEIINTLLEQDNYIFNN